jgi:hypothetical protein
MHLHTIRLMSVALLGLFLMAGCSIKATLDHTTDTTSNVTGTTSGRAWWNEDGQILPAFKAAAFATVNHNSLRQDIAAGRGEYLTSMSVLLGVPREQQSDFCSAVQARSVTIAETQGLELETLLPFLQNTAANFVR